ncbi:MAG: hypothetical protein QF590_04060 [Dehalococcoidia bacterium]|nr:hypothetical protein [Dehalococcoidia bacterium]MDP7090456.1 hypothetical protein [Dehalococcoidia bacterium]MDP7261552.1 hypothetical protein [Dehalococcoidia bacterium]MDP7485338.1 hypothetical protein [Dehalococcoidia bacterium]
MAKYTYKQIVIALIVVASVAGASATVHASTEEPVHAYTTSGSGVKAGFGFGLLVLGSLSMLLFLSRALIDRARK